jgi:DNA invertase Pin-like site-specific DNA recombinase
VEGGERMANLAAEKVKELLKEGKSVSEIAKGFDITRQAVYHHINKIKGKRKAKLDFGKPKKNYNSLIDWRLGNVEISKKRRGAF